MEAETAETASDSTAAEEAAVLEAEIFTSLSKVHNCLHQMLFHKDTSNLHNTVGEGEVGSMVEVAVEDNMEVAAEDSKAAAAEAEGNTLAEEEDIRTETHRTDASLGVVPRLLPNQFNCILSIHSLNVGQKPSIHKFITLLYDLFEK